MNARTVLLALAVGSLLCGCSAQKSVYWPAIANAPTLGEKGDKHVAIHGTFVQGQASAAWAVTDHIALRGSADIAANTSSADLGVGYFWAARNAEGTAAPTGFRWSVSADAGAGTAQTFLAHNTIALNEEGAVTTDWNKSEFDTTFYRAAAQLEVARVYPDFEIVGVIRGTVLSGTVREVAYRKVTGGDLQKEQADRSILWSGVEPVFIVRWSLNERWMGDLQLGGSALAGEYRDEYADAGILWPMIFALGITREF